MKKILVFILFVIGLWSCNTTEPENRLEISVEDVSCTEAWIKVTGETGSEITLNRDGKEVERLTLKSSSQTIYDDSLKPNKTYTYQVSSIKNQESPEGTSSNQLQVTTLDTTSHDITWEKFTFGGEGGSSSLYDCAIISEDDIWCVGEIYLKDSLGQPDPVPYNAVHWDGSKWELRRITVDYKSSFITPPLNGIFTFSSTDIWFSAGVPIHGDGSTWTQYHLFDMGILSSDDGSINKIWGSSSTNLFFVGNRGTIVFYNGSSWQKIESGTDLPIRDIWGDYNDKTNKYEILAVAAEIDVDKGSKVLRIDGSSVTEESNTGLSWDVGGLWFRSGSKYYIAGAGIHYKHFLSDSSWYRYPKGIVTNYVGYGIRGSNINDVFAGGGEIVHFNGVTWLNYQDDILSDDGAVGRMAVKGNLIVTVGGEGRSALVVIGRRN